MTPSTGSRDMESERASTALRRVDAAAGSVATGIVKVAAVAVAVAAAVLAALLVVYFCLWLVSLLSWGSRLEDYDIQPNINPNPAAKCADDPATMKQLGGREFYAGPREDC